MTFQKEVRKEMASYIVGDIAFGGPLLVEPKILLSTSASNNVFGRAFQQVSGIGNDLNVTSDLGSIGVFAGILINSKEHVTSGASTGSLDPIFSLLNNEPVSIMKEGTVAVSVIGTDPVNIGDQVMYDYRSGEIKTRAPAPVLPPANFAFVPNGTVVRCNLPASSGRVALIHFKG